MLDTLWIVFLIASVLLFIISLFMMLYWRVFSLIDELSGRKAKRQIRKLKEYNSSNDSMSMVSTEELELLVSGGGSLLNETVTRLDPSERRLKDMIDDPYGSVGKNAVKINKKLTIEHQEESKYVVDDEVTGLLSDIEMGIRSKKCIIILDEQSSI